MAKQGTSRKAEVSDFNCTVVGLNMTNTISIQPDRMFGYNSMSLTN